jgi:hypothetical protein
MACTRGAASSAPAARARASDVPSESAMMSAQSAYRARGSDRSTLSISAVCPPEPSTATTRAGPRARPDAAAARAAARQGRKNSCRNRNAQLKINAKNNNSNRAVWGASIIAFGGDYSWICYVVAGAATIFFQACNFATHSGTTYNIRFSSNK